jgi:hypothetical protein
LQGKVGRSEVDGAAQFTPATGFPRIHGKPPARAGDPPS